MSHVVLAGGHELAPIVAFLERDLKVKPDWWTGALSAAEANSLNYRDIRDPLPALATRLEAGELASIQMRRERPQRLLLGLYSPHFCGEPSSLWRCVLEGAEVEMASFYDALRNIDGVTFVTLSIEEALVLASEDVSIETFPWQDWRLIQAAVRSPSGEWVERRGPAGH